MARQRGAVQVARAGRGRGPEGSRARAADSRRDEVAGVGAGHSWR